MPDPEKVGFQIIGEVDADKFTELCSVLGRFGVAVKSATELDIVSPSIAIEYVEGADGLSVPAVTETSVRDFLESEGKDPRTAGTMSTTLMWTLTRHIGWQHAFSRQGDQRFNYYREVCRGCECPLVGVLNRFMGGHPYLDSVNPSSLVNFSQLSFQEVRDLGIKGLGIGRFKLICKLADRIRSDTSLEATEL